MTMHIFWCAGDKYMLWNLDAPERIKIFLWKCLKGILPVKENVGLRVHHVSPICPLCDAENESIPHLFCHCPLFNLVWENSEFHKPDLEISQEGSFNNWLLNEIIQHKKNNRKFCFFISVLWAIWKIRNRLIFSGTPFNVDSTLAFNLCLDSYPNKNYSSLLWDR